MCMHRRSAVAATTLLGSQPAATSSTHSIRTVEHITSWEQLSLRALLHSPLSRSHCHTLSRGTKPDNTEGFAVNTQRMLSTHWSVNGTYLKVSCAVHGRSWTCSATSSSGPTTNTSSPTRSSRFGINAA